MRILLRTFCASLLVLAIAFGCNAASAAAKLPNILVVLADGLGQLFAGLRETSIRRKLRSGKENNDHYF